MSVQGRLIIATLVLLSFDATAMAQTTGRDMHTMPDMQGMDMPPTKPKPATRTVPAKHPHPAPAAVTAPSNSATSSHIDTDHSVPMRAPNDHVPPPAPQQPLSAMSSAQMVDTMQMNDRATRAMWTFDRLEYRGAAHGEDSTAWNAEGWWGDDLNKLWLKTEGEHDHDGTRDASTDLLWSHATSTFWDWQLGARHDFGQGPSREWAAAGVQGLTPYWFEIAATFYAGPQGRTAARLEANYDLLFTQRLILSPGLELNFYGKDDPQRDIRSGLAEAEAGLRLRYEFSRRFAPYAGIDWTRHFGHFDNPSNDPPTRDTTFVAGVRFWF